MSPEEGAASADSTQQDVNPEGASTDLQAENTRLRQENARNKQVMAQARDYVDVALLLDKAPGGKEIITKLLKSKESGEPVNLTQAQQAKVEDATAAAGATGITPDQLAEAFDKYEQKTFDRENAREANRVLHDRAIEELPGFESMYKSDVWARKKSVILALAQADPSIIPEADADDAYWWLYKETHAQLVSQNPDVGKVKRVGKPESERRGAIVGVSQQSAAAPEEIEENLPSHVKFLKSRESRKGKTLTSLYGKTR